MQMVWWCPRAKQFLQYAVAVAVLSTETRCPAEKSRTESPKIAACCEERVTTTDVAVLP